MRHEWNDGLAGKISNGKEAENGGSHRAPPVRRTDKYHVVFGEVWQRSRELRFESVGAFFFRLFDAGIIIRRIGLCRLDLEKFPAGGLLYLFRHGARIAAIRVADDQYLPRFCCGGGLGSLSQRGENHGSRAYDRDH